jgi:hypothetical protein
MRLLSAQGQRRCRVALASILIVAASAKLLASAGEQLSRSHVAIASAEMVVAVGLFTDRWVQSSLLFVAALAVVGSVDAFTTNSNCSCFGAYVSMGWRAHVVLCSLMGMMVAFGWPNSIAKKRIILQPRMESQYHE